MYKEKLRALWAMQPHRSDAEEGPGPGTLPGAGNPWELCSAGDIKCVHMVGTAETLQ